MPRPYDYHAIFARAGAAFKTYQVGHWIVVERHLATHLTGLPCIFPHEGLSGATDEQPLRVNG